jgi:hypothetical protein
MIRTGQTDVCWFFGLLLWFVLLVTVVMLRTLFLEYFETLDGIRAFSQPQAESFS